MLSLGVVNRCLPFVPELFDGRTFVLLLPRLLTEPPFVGSVGNALLQGVLFDLRGAAAELFNRGSIDARDLPARFGRVPIAQTAFANRVAKFMLQFPRKPGLELRLQARSLPNDLFHLARVVLPGVLGPIDDKSVNVQMRICLTIDGPRRLVQGSRRRSVCRSSFSVR